MMLVGSTNKILSISDINYDRMIYGSLWLSLVRVRLVVNVSPWAQNYNLHHIYAAFVMDYNKANKHVTFVESYVILFSLILKRSTLIARKNNLYSYHGIQSSSNFKM